MSHNHVVILKVDKQSEFARLRSTPKACPRAYYPHMASRSPYREHAIYSNQQLLGASDSRCMVFVWFLLCQGLRKLWKKGCATNDGNACDYSERGKSSQERNVVQQPMAQSLILRFLDDLESHRYVATDKKQKKRGKGVVPNPGALNCAAKVL